MENDKPTTFTVTGMGCGRTVAMTMRDMAASVEIDPDAVDWSAYSEEEKGYMVRLIAMRKAFGTEAPLLVSTKENGLKVMAKESFDAMLRAEIRNAALARATRSKPARKAKKA